MNTILAPLLSLTVLLSAADLQAAAPLNPLEIPKYVRQWFSGKDFTGTHKMSGHYRQSRLNGTNFQGMKFRGAEFEQCDLADANMQGAVFGPGTKFFRSTLNGANLQGADFSGATLDSVNFRGADLRKSKGMTNVKKINFQRADLRGADLSKIRNPLDQVVWTDAIYDAKTKFPAGFDPAAVGAKTAR
jgi:uncharacterized protein YjbI with pentapeptide repeats